MQQHSFLYHALILLAAAVVFVPIAKKLNLGSVLGYLLAGIVIGPSLLALVIEEGGDIMHFEEYGIIMMLFLIGLELEPKKLWKLRRSILGLGGLQLLLTCLAITGLPFCAASKDAKKISEQLIQRRSFIICIRAYLWLTKYNNNVEIQKNCFRDNFRTL
jgi:Kef-type K+ transport system membrane component KefB